MAVWEAALAALLAEAVGSAAGLLPGLCCRNSHRRDVDFMLALSAGMLVALGAFDRLPEAILLGGPGALLLGTLLGSTAAILLLGLRPAGRARGGSMLLLSLCDGLFIGAGFALSPTRGAFLALSLLAQKVPVAFAFHLPCDGGNTPPIGVSALLACGLAAGPGALLGALGGPFPPQLTGGLLALSGGLLLYFAFGALLPPTGESRGRRIPFGCVLGLLLGMALCYLV